jgi:hypothetical protein
MLSGPRLGLWEPQPAELYLNVRIVTIPSAGMVCSVRPLNAHQGCLYDVLTPVGEGKVQGYDPVHKTRT